MLYYINSDSLFTQYNIGTVIFPTLFRVKYGKFSKKYPDSGECCFLRLDLVRLTLYIILI